jgi:hypothetical protein
MFKQLFQEWNTYIAVRKSTLCFSWVGGSVLETIVRPSVLFFAIVLTVFNRCTAFDYPFDIFKLITIAGQLNTNIRRIIFSNTTIDSHRSIFLYRRTIMTTFILIWIDGQLSINCFIPEIH